MQQLLGQLLVPGDPPPFSVHNEKGKAPLLLLCDHASKAVPQALGDLGISDTELSRHIGWDIGGLDAAIELARALDAPLVASGYSRLVIDCNRDPNVPSSIPEISESTEIPGNRGLGEAARRARVEAIFRPYHERIAAALDRRAAAGRGSVLVALHSFTPVFKGVARPWHAAVLYNRDARLAHPLFRLLSAEDGLVIGDNEPYAVSDLTDYTVPVHGERRGLPHVEVEIRQDQITDPAGQTAWAERLACLLPAAYAEFLRR